MTTINNRTHPLSFFEYIYILCILLQCAHSFYNIRIYKNTAKPFTIFTIPQKPNVLYAHWTLKHWTLQQCLTQQSHNFTCSACCFVDYIFHSKHLEWDGKRNRQREFDIILSHHFHSVDDNIEFKLTGGLRKTLNAYAAVGCRHKTICI